MIRVRYICGHEALLSPTATSAPLCHCGEHRVRAVTSPAPRFTGACRGPYAETKAVEPGIVNVAPGGPLKLKELT